MATKRKKVTMLVTVTVPAETSAADARQEVRTLINWQGNWRLEPGDVRAIAVKPFRET